MRSISGGRTAAGAKKQRLCIKALSAKFNSERMRKGGIYQKRGNAARGKYTRTSGFKRTKLLANEKGKIEAPRSCNKTDEGICNLHDDWMCVYFCCSCLNLKY